MKGLEVVLPHRARDRVGQGGRRDLLVQCGAQELWKLAGPSGVITGAGALFLATRLLNFHLLPVLTFDLACLSPHLNSCHLASSGCFFSVQTAGLCLFFCLVRAHQSKELFGAG